MKRAFTLIELIVVVAIILILAAILFPVINHGDRESPSAACRSNLKQIGVGFAQYVQDYDERFPSARLSSSTGWADGLWPYLKNQQPFQCPSAPQGGVARFSTDYFYNRRLARAAKECCRAYADDPLRRWAR